MSRPPSPPMATTPLTMASTEIDQSATAATNTGLAGRLPGIRGM